MSMRASVSAGAVPARGEDLPWVEEPLRVEGPLQVAFEQDELVRLLDRQVRSLGDADPVLSGKRTPETDDVVEKLLDAAFDQRSLAVVVPEEIHVQVAVSRVSVRERADAGPLALPRCALEQLSEALSGHDDVLGELVLRHFADGPAHLAPRGPELLALRTLARDDEVERRHVRERAGDALGLRLARAFVAVDL